MITLGQARDLLRRAVETQGRDFIYRPHECGGVGSCHYTVELFQMDCERAPVRPKATDPRLKTGCLIGVALDLAGETWHHGYVGGVADSRLQRHIPMEELAVSYLEIAQCAQDQGHPWGYAHDRAEEWAAQFAQEGASA